MDMTEFIKRAPRKPKVPPHVPTRRPEWEPSAYTRERITEEFSLLIAAARAGKLPLTSIDICHPLPIRISDPNAAVVKCLEQFDKYGWIDGWWLWERLSEIQRGVGWGVAAEAREAE